MGESFPRFKCTPAAESPRRPAFVESDEAGIVRREASASRRANGL